MKKQAKHILERWRRMRRELKLAKHNLKEMFILYQGLERCYNSLRRKGDKLMNGYLYNLALKIVLKIKGVKDMLSKLRGSLDGKKTYIVGIVAVLGVILAWLNNSMTDIEAVKAIIEALMGMTIRAGISKV